MILKKIWILTLFPEYFRPFLDCGVAGSAYRGERGGELKFEIHLVNIRDFSTSNYKSVDDSPYGGGPGMIMRGDILRDALMKGVVEAGHYSSKKDLLVIYTSPRGVAWNYQTARAFAEDKLVKSKEDLVFICGRYEGVDERFLEKYVDEFYSLGDFVLTGGEIPVMALLDSAIRFVPGVLGNSSSSDEDSFEDGLLEYPQFTRPPDFEGVGVPEVLLSGHHKKIQEWKKEQKKLMTQKWRGKKKSY